MTPISSNLFSFSKETNSFATEASSIPTNAMGQIYPDACDVGFEMVSAKTGKTVKFVLVEEERDREGDLLATVFKCITKGHLNLSAVIFND